MQDVIIVGRGLATPAGLSLTQCWQALEGGFRIADHARSPLSPSPASQMPRVCALARHVAHQAIAEAGWTEGDLKDNHTALVVGTSKGPVEAWLECNAGDTRAGDCGRETQRATCADEDVRGISAPALSHMLLWPYVAGGLHPTGMAEIAADLAGHLGLGYGPRLTCAAACSSGLHALIRAVLLTRFGEARRALVVAAESSLHDVFIGSFRRLGVLSPPGEYCRPFDHNRSGFLVSEAAAAVCLEPVDAIDATNAKGAALFRPARVAIERLALGADATHLTAVDPQAVTTQRLIADVVAGQPVDLIHAHGTGTTMNDPAELAAIESSLPPEARPAIYSHKGALGHSLGAASLVAVVLNTLMHERGMVLPNICTQSPLPMSRALIARHAIMRPIRRSIVLAAGFGGVCAAASLTTRP